METGQQDELMARLGRALSEQMGFPVAVELARGRIRLSGAAGSVAERAAAEESVAELAPGRPIQNEIAVAPRPRTTGPDAYGDAGQPPDGDTALDTVSLGSMGDADLEPGLMDQPLETNAINVADVSVSDQDPVTEPDPAYFAPTDPVLRVDEQGRTDVLGGFTPTSTTSDAVDRSAEDGQLGDEAIADAVRRELREDALTTALEIDVAVDGGVVRLRGRVDSLDDAEGAEEVAGRVPGVRAVREELDIAPRP